MITAKRSVRIPTDAYVNGYKVHTWKRYDTYVTEVTDRYGRSLEAWGTTVLHVAIHTHKRMVEKYREKSMQGGRKND